MERLLLILKDKKMRKSYKGFTLLESLLSLLLLALICLLFFSILKSSKNVISQLKINEEKAWQIFLIQLENELDYCHFEEVLTNKIVLTSKKDNRSFLIENKLGKIVKVHNSGYQPLLMNVKTAEFEEKKGNIEITVWFDNNRKFTGRWVITKE